MTIRTSVLALLAGAGSTTSGCASADLSSYDQAKLTRCEQGGAPTECYDAGIALIRADEDDEGKRLIAQACRASVSECGRIEGGAHRPYPKPADPAFVEHLRDLACARPSDYWPEREHCLAWWDERVEAERAMALERTQLAASVAARKKREAALERERERDREIVHEAIERGNAERARRFAEAEDLCSDTHDVEACSRADFMALGADPDDPAERFDMFLVRMRSLLTLFVPK